MRIRLKSIQKLSPAFGYLLISIFAAGIVFPLAYDDWRTIVFALILIGTFLIGVSTDTSGKPADSDLAQVGWVSDRDHMFVPIGVITGMLALFLGGLIMELFPQGILSSSATITQQNMALLSAALVPDYSGIKLGQVIPVYMAVGANIIAQFFVIAPSEESLSKIYLPWGFMSLFKNLGVAYLFGQIGWVLLHVFTFIAQNASSAMYLVLLMLGGVTLLIYSFTKSIFSSSTAHSTFNSGVILLSSGMNIITFGVISSIGAALTYIWLQPKGGKK